MSLREKLSFFYVALVGNYKIPQVMSWHMRVVLSLSAIVFVSCCLAGGYRWYMMYQEQKAQEVFASCMREYERAEQDPLRWPDAELVFKLGYEQFRRTKTGIYFLAFQAEALARQSKADEARACMYQCVSLMAADSPLYYLYATKYALMLLDSGDPDVREQGLTSLHKLAQNSANANADMACYYTGLYYWTKNDMKQARAIWQPLEALAADESVSAWARLAMAKLEQLPA